MRIQDAPELTPSQREFVLGLPASTPFTGLWALGMMLPNTVTILLLSDHFQMAMGALGLFFLWLLFIFINSVISLLMVKKLNDNPPEELVELLQSRAFMYRGEFSRIVSYSLTKLSVLGLVVAMFYVGLHFPPILVIVEQIYTTFVVKPIMKRACLVAVMRYDDGGS